MSTNTKRVLQWTTIHKAPDSPQGVHLLADFWGGKVIESQEFIEKILIVAAKKSGNTALRTIIHKFKPQGLTGVVLLEESHISIHSWPEFKYVGVDVFTCGADSNPRKALEYLKSVFKPKKVQVREVSRGLQWTRKS